MTLRIRQIRIDPLAIPMRVRFEHAAATRAIADPLVVGLQAEAPFGDLVGYGETLARSYVTGETAESVPDDIAAFFAPHLLDFRADSFPEAIERIEELPRMVEGRLLHAARTAIELALLDLAGKAFRRRITDVLPLLDLPHLTRGCLETMPYSGIVVGRKPGKLKTLLRAQAWYGLRDFKLKVAIPGWEQRVALAARVLGRRLARGTATLRVDANGGWTADELLAAVPLLQRHGVSAIEQPLAVEADGELAGLSGGLPLDLIADESLQTAEDAERLIARGVKVMNIRIAKHGGLLPALRIANLALDRGADVQLGCLVGETSILSAAGVGFLQCVPRVRFAEGCFGPFLLTGDVVRKPLRFGYRGRVRAPGGFGLGLDVDQDRIETLGDKPAIVIQL